MSHRLGIHLGCRKTRPQNIYINILLSSLFPNKESLKDSILDNYPRAFLKKQRGYCNRLRPSVCPLCYLLLNNWTKFNQIWCVSYSHEWGVQRQTFFGPAPWGPGKGSKGQISFNFNHKVNFKDFYTKLCVCSHK